MNKTPPRGSKSLKTPSGLSVVTSILNQMVPSNEGASIVRTPPPTSNSNTPLKGSPMDISRRGTLERNTGTPSSNISMTTRSKSPKSPMSVSPYNSRPSTAKSIQSVTSIASSKYFVPAQTDGQLFKIEKKRKYNDLESDVQLEQQPKKQKLLVNILRDEFENDNARNNFRRLSSVKSGCVSMMDKIPEEIEQFVNEQAIYIKQKLGTIGGINKLIKNTFTKYMYTGVHDIPKAKKNIGIKVCLFELTPEFISLEDLIKQGAAISTIENVNLGGHECGNLIDSAGELGRPVFKTKTGSASGENYFFFKGNEISDYETEDFNNKPIQVHIFICTTHNYLSSTAPLHTSHMWLTVVITDGEKITTNIFDTNSTNIFNLQYARQISLLTGVYITVLSPNSEYESLYYLSTGLQQTETWGMCQTFTLIMYLVILHNPYLASEDLETVICRQGLNQIILNLGGLLDFGLVMSNFVITNKQITENEFHKFLEILGSGNADIKTVLGGKNVLGIKTLKNNINNKDSNGNTALHLAAMDNKIFIIDFLLKHGADVKIKNNNGETALDILNKLKKKAFEKLQISENLSFGSVSVRTLRFRRRLSIKNTRKMSRKRKPSLRKIKKRRSLRKTKRMSRKK